MAETGMRVVKQPRMTMLSVRVPSDSPSADALEKVLGLHLPTLVGEVSSDGEHDVLWLGPDEWLVVSGHDAHDLTGDLSAAVTGAHAAIVDVSANRAIIELSGTSARSVLQKGCPLDLHPRVFRPGTAVSTTLARVPVMLWQVGPESYWLLPRTSFADYVTRWLADASVEFGGASMS